MKPICVNLLKKLGAIEGIKLVQFCSIILHVTPLHLLLLIYLLVFRYFVTSRN